MRYIKVGSVDKQRAVIYKTSDGGEHWSAYDPSEIYMAQSTCLNKVTCNSAGKCVAVGNKGIMSSIDGGENWKANFVNFPLDYEDVYCSGDNNQYCTAISPGHKTISIATSSGSDHVWQARSPYDLRHDASIEVAVGGG
jgi:hypothetical protein